MPQQPDTREDLHRLVDELPDAELHPALRYLEYALNLGTHVHTIETAPLDDEPLTEEDIRALEEARADVEQGRYVTTEELRRELGLSEKPPVEYAVEEPEPRDALHDLVNLLPEDEQIGARRYLEYLVKRHWEPVIETDLTDEERAEIREGREAVGRGEYVTLAEFKRDLGL